MSMLNAVVSDIMQSYHTLTNYQPVSTEVPLNETHTETSEKTERTADDIFGKFYTGVKLRTTEERNTWGWKQVISATLTGGGCISGIMTGLFTMTLIIPAKIGVFASAGTCGVGITSWGLLLSNGISHPKFRKTEHILAMCDSISQLSNAFDKFKNNPCEAEIKPLFDKLDALNAVLHDRLYEAKDEDNQPINHFEGMDLALLDGAGKLFLMDAVIKMMLEKNPEAPIFGDWIKMQKCPINEDFNEPWNRLGIANPDRSAYIHFNNKKESINSLAIVNNMIAFFKTALEDEALR